MMEKGGGHGNEIKREKMDQRWRDKKGDETTRRENGMGVVEGKQNWICRALFKGLQLRLFLDYSFVLAIAKKKKSVSELTSHELGVKTPLHKLSTLTFGLTSYFRVQGQKGKQSGQHVDCRTDSQEDWLCSPSQSRLVAGTTALTNEAEQGDRECMTCHPFSGTEPLASPCPRLSCLANQA
ncbi:hypothetical protein FQN60_009966 [Etheostoma spectabile]|uniref:Uncharacterized protein n=1 Tax=Etheostoma spectabile TaxID=54343 RepID=A0A5J5DAD9_9PERO|nr:hypothetical protein FQN60_009966 [Etheostoma spectabile]